MNFYSTPSPYPWDAFHLVSREAIEEVVRNVQAPVALIAMEFLANMSASIQGLYDVHLPTGQTCPTSLYLAVIAESGERKTAVHHRQRRSTSLTGSARRSTLPIVSSTNWQ